MTVAAIGGAELVILAAGFVVPAVLLGVIASRRGARNAWLYGIAGLLFSWLAFFLIFTMPKAGRSRADPS